MADLNRRIEAIRPYLSGSERVLDVGTGMGHFMDELDPLVEFVCGTEINEKRLSFIRNQLGYPVFEGTGGVLEEFETHHFDVITLFHTLEHLVNPVEQLRSLRTLLSDNGRMFIEVPNHDDWLLSASRAYANFYYQEAHSYYFTPRTIEFVCKLAGFESEIAGIQRYSYRNALHWLLHGEPELDEPSRHINSYSRPLDLVYGSILSRIGRTDTLWVVCSTE